MYARPSSLRQSHSGGRGRHRCPRATRGGRCGSGDRDHEESHEPHPACLDGSPSGDRALGHLLRAHRPGDEICVLGVAEPDVDPAAARRGRRRTVRAAGADGRRPGGRRRRGPRHPRHARRRRRRSGLGDLRRRAARRLRPGPRRLKERRRGSIGRTSGGSRASSSRRPATCSRRRPSPSPRPRAPTPRRRARRRAAAPAPLGARPRRHRRRGPPTESGTVRKTSTARPALHDDAGDAPARGLLQRRDANARWPRFRGPSLVARHACTPVRPDARASGAAAYGLEGTGLFDTRRHSRHPPHGLRDSRS